MEMMYEGRKIQVLDLRELSATIIDGEEQKTVSRAKLKPVPTYSPVRTPVYVAQAVPEAIFDFVGYLKSSEYTLHVVCRTEEQVEQVATEYAEWSGGESLPEETILTSFDGSKWDREWFLIFKYSPDISYPFSVLERGTGGRKRQSSPVAWHRKGKIESCYAAVAEQLVRSGLRANY
jgi:hypothetical protein